MVIDGWIQGFTKEALKDSSSNPIWGPLLGQGPHPWKLLLHTTEGTTVRGAINSYHSYPPHFVVNPKTKERIQHIPLTRSSLALRSTRSERGPVVQVEIVGFAATSSQWSVSDLNWLADAVFGPIRGVCPFGLTAPKFEGSAATSWGMNAISRFTYVQWEQFSGIVGHQHSPGDSHWDPGAVNVPYLLARLASNPTTTNPIQATPGGLTVSLLTDLVHAYELHPTKGRTPSTSELRDWGQDLLPKSEAQRFDTLLWISDTVAAEDRPPTERQWSPLSEMVTGTWSTT